LEESTGEITPEIEACEKELDEYLAASVDKVESAIVVIQNLEGDAETLKAEEKRLAERRRSLEGNSERLRGIVASVLDRVFKSKIKTLKFTASVSQSKGATKIELAPDADAGVCYKENPELFKKPVLDNPAVKVFCDRMGGTPSWLTVEDLPGKRSLRIR
jgi:hypothetical protein